MPDPYEIIGVRRDASLDEIRIAYRRSAQVLHPDRFATSSDGVRSEAARRMLQLNGAMEAIEVERADEASGTGTLGSVSFGGGHTPTATASAPSSAPPRPAPPAAAPSEPAGTNGTTPAHRGRHPAARSGEAAGRALPATRAEPAPMPTPAPAPAKEPVAETTSAPVDDPGQTQGRELAAFVAPPAEKPDAFDPPPARPAPSAAPVPAPPAAEPAPEPEREPERPYSLHSEFTFEDDDSEYDDDLPPVSRRARQRGSRSIVPALIAGIVIVVALAVIAGYFVFGRSSGTGESDLREGGRAVHVQVPLRLPPAPPRRWRRAEQARVPGRVRARRRTTTCSRRRTSSASASLTTARRPGRRVSS